MPTPAQDIAELAALRDTLQRMTDRARASWGVTFDDEIALLDRVIVRYNNLHPSLL